MDSSLYLKNGSVTRGPGPLPRGRGWCKDGACAWPLGTDIHDRAGTGRWTSPEWRVVPGFLDVHTHGGDGSGRQRCRRPGPAERSAGFFARHGASPAGCARILTDTPSSRHSWCIEQAQAGHRSGPCGPARLLGVHLEGPCLSSAVQGRHAASTC
ncbi:MAG: hypothetical protein ACLRWQ_17860 [Flavonifractor plautii]